MKPGKCWALNEVCPHADLCSTLSSTCQRRPTPCPEYEEAGSSPAAGMIAESIGAWPCRYCGEAREKHPPVTEPCGDPACPACSPDQAGTGHLYKCHAEPSAEPSVTVQLTLKPVLTDLRVGGSANLLESPRIPPWTRGACDVCGCEFLYTRGESRPDTEDVRTCSNCASVHRTLLACEEERDAVRLALDPDASSDDVVILARRMRQERDDAIALTRRMTAIIDALYPGKRAALIENWYATFPAAGLFREKPGTTVRSQVRVGPFVDVISPKESRIWLVYNEACEKQADGTEVWFGDFVSCGEDPLEAEKMARAEREHAAKIIEIGVENRRLDAEADAAGRPRPTIHQGPPLWPEYPETWVDYVVNEGGWADALYIEDASGDGARDWLLRQGIAPGQPFLVRFFGFRPATPDYWGEYDGEDWSYEILARGPAPEDGDAAEIIAEAWAIAERHGSFCPFGYPRTCGSGCHKPLGGDVFTCEAEDGETP